MTNEKNVKIQIVEPFVLFNNLAEGAFSETDEGIEEWATQHGLDIAAVAEDNRKHLEQAVTFALERLAASQITDGLPKTVNTVKEAKEVRSKLKNEGFALASRNERNLTEADEIRRANQMLLLYRQS